jgi:hypothetical protein
MGAFVDQISHGHNVWFGVNLLSKAERKKENALPGYIVWADLDTVEPVGIDPPPSCVVKSSPDRFQGYWRLDKLIVPEAQEEFSRKLAYKYHFDKSGWDLTQILRVPFTFNYKPEYERQGEEPPAVEILWANEDLYSTDVFERIEVHDPYAAKDVVTDKPLPEVKDLPSVSEVQLKYISKITPSFHELFELEPGKGDDWSRKIWRFINYCLETGMSEEETLVMAMNAKCNKYERDHRPLSHLWKEVLKASEKQQAVVGFQDGRPAFKLEMPKLVEDEEIGNPFIMEYKAWAMERTDAPPQYHELCAAILLSALFSPRLRLETSSGEVIPNLWGIILGGSTLARKSTSMGFMHDILLEFDRELILAQDASPEGLLFALSQRPHRVSMFYRDELSGFLKSLRSKKYNVDLPELLANLYDAPATMTRLLRKETHTLLRPFFIIMGAGIRDAVYAEIEEDWITGGFIPRFLVVSGDTTRDQRRRTGPPVPGNFEKRQNIIKRLADVMERYEVTTNIKTISGVHQQTDFVTAYLSEGCWELYGEYEDKLEVAAEKSIVQTVAFPTFARLSSSLLKLATLFSALRSTPNDENAIEVIERDLIEAAYYIQKWGKHAVELVLYAGKADIDKKSDRVYEFIRNKPGVNQTEVFYRLHLRSMEGKEIIATLIDRGQIYQLTEKGQGTRFYAYTERTV